MDALELKKVFDQEFDLVRVMKTNRYIEAAKELGINIPNHPYKSMVVLALAYPKRIIPSTKDKLYGSFYTFGRDYHLILKEKIKRVMQPLNINYELGVDNHPHDERLAAVVSGLGFFGKNQLIINPLYGSYIFLALVFIDDDIDQELIGSIDDSCKDCRACIDACPTQALAEEGYLMHRCISFFNQEKKTLTDDEIKKNYCLFGCDICQLACPKNRNIANPNHSEFALTGKEGVSIVDLFSLSERDFRKAYQDMAYLWKGKTILMRNALTLLLKQKNTAYNEMIEMSLSRYRAAWYNQTAANVLKKLKETK